MTGLRLLWVLAIAGLVLFHQAIGGTNESLTMQYQNAPLVIDVTVDSEMRIHFGESVELGVPQELVSKLDVSSVQGTVYLTAMEAFSRQRVLVKRLKNGRFVLLDVSASTRKSMHQNIVIQLDQEGGNTPTTREPTPVEITRFAAQQLLAPRRLLVRDKSIRSASTKFDFDTVYLSDQLNGKYLSSWRTKHLFAIAYSLENVSDDILNLTPDAVRGDWNTVSFLATQLHPENQGNSTTVMILVGATSRDLAPFR